VSIAIAVRCTDGIVLCADTQITWAGSHKSYERKISAIGRDAPRACVVFAYAGNPELMKMFVENFSNIFRDTQYVVSVAAIRQTIVDVLEEMGSVVANDAVGLTMLCGVSLEGEEDIVLLKISGQIIRPVDLYDYVGVGDCSVVRYLSKVLFQSRNSTVKTASLRAVYLILQAKAFIDECGGETDLINLLPDGRICHHDHGYTISQEHQTSMLEFFLARIISSLSNPADTEGRLDGDIDRFVRRLKDTAKSW
jgi:20S proteasome alpha/beta subunit